MACCGRGEKAQPPTAGQASWPKPDASTQHWKELETGVFGQTMDGIVYRWEKGGTLLEYSKKNTFPPEYKVLKNLSEHDQLRKDLYRRTRRRLLTLDDNQSAAHSIKKPKAYQALAIIFMIVGFMQM